MAQPYFGAPGSRFPTHYCKLGHCTSTDESHTYRGAPMSGDRCGAAVYKESGHFSYWCDASIQPLTPELESAYRVGGEWAVQDLLGVMPNSVARRWV